MVEEMGRGESRYALKSSHCEPGYLGLCLESLSDWCELKENFGWVSYWAGCYCRDRVKILISRILFTISKCSHAWLQHFLLETGRLRFVVCSQHPIQRRFYIAVGSVAN